MNLAVTSPANGKISIRFNGWEFRHSVPRMSNEEFEMICRENPDLRIELDKNGNLLVMPPVSLGSENHEIEAGADLVIWNRQSQLGMVFSSQTMFSLPDGAKRMADAAWISTRN
jgi:Uma2 family endonuclease